jgi:hypothetical protein
MQSEELDTGVRVHSEFSFFGRFAGSSSQEPPREQDEFLQAWNDRRVSPRGTPDAACKPPQMEFHLAQTER